jgi:hypothetical protein
MPMSDPVLAAIITATATICMSLLQLRFSLGKDGGARLQAAGGKRVEKITRTANQLEQTRAGPRSLSVPPARQHRRV